MRCRMLKLTPALLALSLSSCANFREAPVDDYCVLYNKVIKEKGDGKIVAPPKVKRRIFANETTYGSVCP